MFIVIYEVVLWIYYRNLYYQMVRASERALRELEQQNFGNARNILISAQQEAEEQYLRQTDGQKLP